MLGKRGARGGWLREQTLRNASQVLSGEQNILISGSLTSRP